MFRRYLLLAFALLGTASFAADLEISTSDYLIEPGEEVQVDVRVDNVDALIVFSVIVNWDDSLVEFVDAFGVQMGPRVLSSETSTQSNLLSVTSFSILGDTVVSAGTGTLFSFKLKGLQRGVSPISFSSVTATAVSGDVTDKLVTNGSVDMGIGDVLVTPPGGTYLTGQTVSLSAEGAETIYYSTDGSVPSTSSLVYSSPLDISGPDGSNKRLRVLAVSASDRESSADELYIFDSASPESTIDLAPGQQDPTNIGTVIFAIDFSEDVTGFEQGDIQLSGTALPSSAILAGGPQKYTVTVTGMSTAGTVVIDFAAGAALDAVTSAPSASPTHTDNSVLFDQTLPASGITTTGTQGSENWPGHVSGTASDVGSGVANVAVAIQRFSDNLHWNGSGWGSTQLFLEASGTESWQLPLPTNQLHDDVLYLIQSRATDAAGNTQSSNATSSFTFDATIPSGSFFIGFGNPSITSQTGTSLFIAVNDATQMRFQNAGGGFSAWLNYASFTNWTLLNQDGQQTVNGEFRNVGGNVLQISDSILVDLNPPVCTAVTVGAFGPNTWTGFVSGTATDSVSAIEPVEIAIRRNSDQMWFTGATWSSTQTFREAVGIAPWSVPLAQSALTNGDSYRIFCRVSDAAGNDALYINDEFSWDDQPPTGDFSINSGDPEFAISATVDLHIDVSGASEMRFKNDGGEFSAWMPFSSLVEDWVLKQRDGQRQVDGEFRDDAGNLLAVNDGITLDTAGPNGSFSISIGDPEYVNNTATVLFMLVADAALMRFRNAGDASFGPWETYLTIKNWTLPAVDGSLTVEGEFQDLAGNITALSDSVTLDTVPPDGTLSIGNGNPAYTSTPGVTLFNIVTGATEMRFHNGNSSFGDWQDIEPSLEWTLVDEDGIRSVTAQYRDLAQNTLTRSDTIILDRTAPSAAVSTSGFHGNVTWSGQISGTAADAASGIASVAITIQRDSDDFYYNGSGWAAGETQLAAFGTSSWTYFLAVGQLSDGVSYTTSAVATDKVGLDSPPASASFTFDQNPPACSIDISGAYRSDNWPGTLSGRVTDSVSGIASITISVRRTSDGFFYDGVAFAQGETLLQVTGTDPWTSPLPANVLDEGDSYTLRCRVADIAGNSADSATTTFSLDDTAPTGSFVIGAGDPPFVTDPAVTLAISVTGAVEMRFANDAEPFGNWQNYQTSLSWNLAPSDGTRSVRAEFRDLAGNVLALTDSINLDLLPPDGAFTITAADSAFVAGASVQLAIAVNGADHMRFRNDGDVFGDWITYAETLDWTLRAEDGLQTVFGEFRDLAQHVTALSDSTTLDTVFPLGDMSIGAGNPASSTSLDVTLVSTVTGAHQMRIRNDSEPFGQWQDFAASFAWTLPALDGLHSVSVEYRDEAHNTISRSDSILLDRAAPFCTVATSAFYGVNTWPGAISGTAGDATSGLDSLAITIQRQSDGMYFDGADWGVPQVELTPTGSGNWSYGLAIEHLGHGLVYDLSCVATDKVGLVSATATASFTFDENAPTCIFSVSGAYRSGNWPNALGGAVSDDVSGVDSITISVQRDSDGFFYTGSGFADGEVLLPVLGTAPWTRNLPLADLAEGETYSLRCQVADVAGNTANSASTSFAIDDTAPTGSFIIGDGDPLFVISEDVTLFNNVTGATEMRFANDAGAFGNWQDYAATAEWTLAATDGSRIVRAEYRDEAGNVLAVVDAVVLDLLPPTGGFTIGAANPAFVVSPDVQLAMNVTGANQMRFRNDGETFGAWLTYAATLEWDLRDEDGTRTVFGEFRDIAGNVITPDDSTELDRTAPSCSISLAAVLGPNTWTGQLIGTGSDTGSGLNTVRIRLQRQSDGHYFNSLNWQSAAILLPVNGTDNWTFPVAVSALNHGETYTVTCVVADLAGNSAEDVAGSFSFDNVAPVGSISTSGLYSGDSWPNAVSGSASDADSGVAEVRVTVQRDSDGAYFTGTAWQVEQAHALANGADPWNLSLAIGHLGDGESYSASAVIVDGAGNTANSASSSFTIDTSPPSGSFSVGAGNPELTASTSVILVNGIAGAQDMRFANEGEAFTAWEGFFATKDWELPLAVARSDNGPRKVLAEFRDAAGNVAAFEDSIVLDTIFPSGGFTIGAGDPAFVTDTSVTLAIAVDGATEMRFANGSDSFGAFGDYESELAWVIPSGEGAHTVRGEFRDAAGNTVATNDAVTLDTEPPIGSFVVDGGPTVGGLQLSLLVGVSGATEMRFRNDGETFSETWVVFANTYEWTLRDEDGLRTIFGEFRDGAGHVLSAQTTVTLDNTPPDGSFSIGNGNPTYTAARELKLQVLVNGATQMRFANDAEAFGGWQAFATQVDWVLADADGTRTTRAEFRDAAGNVLALEDTIILDRIFPSCVINTSGTVGADWANVVTGSVSDEGSGVGAATLTIKRNSDNFYFNGVTWVNAVVPLAVSGDWSVPLPLNQLEDGESYTFTCQVTDLAGNTPPAESATVFLDNVAPTCTVTTAGLYNIATWQGAVIGTAFDGTSGLASVRVSISRQADGFFWDGADWVDGQVDLDVTAENWSVPLALGNLGDDSYDVICNATDLAGNVANSASSTFTVDGTGPSGSFSIGAGNPEKVNNTRVTLVSAVNGASQMRLRQLDGSFGGWIPFAATTHWDLEDREGEHLVQIEYRDAADNRLLLSDTVILDRVPPNGSFTIGPADPQYTRLLEVGLISAVNEAVKMRFRNDDGVFGDFIDYSDSVAFTISPGEGERTVFAEYKDDAGNILGVSDTIIVDTRGPTGSFTIGVTSPLYVNTTTVKLALRIDGVTQMRFSNDGEPFTEWTNYVDTVNYELKDEDGIRTVTAEFRDIAGNVLSLNDTVLLDRVAPTCVITSTGVFRPESWPGNASGTASDNASGVASVGIILQRLSDLRYYTGEHWVGDETLVDVQPPTNWSVDLPVARLSNGEYQISCIPVDGAGNAAAPEITTFFFDDAGPECATEMQGPYTALNWPGAITGTVSDPSGVDSVKIRLRRSNGDYWHGTVWGSGAELLPTTGAGSWSYSISADQLPGENTFTVDCVATDTANNVTDETLVTFVLDTLPPAGSFSIGENDPEYTSQRGVLFRNAVTGATLMRFRNAGEEFTDWQTYAISKNWTLPDSQPGPGEFDNGGRIVHAEFQDANGNILALSDSIILDTVPPNGSFSINEGNPTYSISNSVTLYFDVQGATQMRLRNSGSPFSSWLTYAPTREWQLLGGDGTRGVEAQFQDDVGNTFTISDSIIVDKVRPTGNFYIISSTATYATTAQITLRSFISGATEMRFKNDGEEFSDWVTYGETFQWFLRDEDGQRQVYAEYKDVAGNVLSLNDTIFRDVTLPTCEVLTEGLLSTGSWPGSIRGKGNDNASGIDTVRITFYRDIDKLWYNGTNWTSDKFNLTPSGRDSWSYAFSAPQLVASNYTVVCTIVDNAGNIGTDTAIFTWDTSPPTCEITMEAAYNINTWPGAITGTASDIPSGVETVTITLKRSSDGLYWHDDQWAIDPYPLIADGTDNWSLPMNIGILAVDATYTATCVATDLSGLSSPVDSVDFVVDGAAPQGSFTIGAGDPTHTTSANVVLHSNVDGAIEMRFANEGDAFSDWENYATTKNWTLPADVARSSSPKTVQAEFKDVADNVLSLADSIIFDDEAPTGSFVIGVGDPEGSNSRDVVVVVSVDGATEMRVANDNGEFSAWVPLQESFAWELADVQGLRTVNLQARDDAGNVHSMTDTIILDTVAPIGSFEINAGNPDNTNARTVEIVIGISGAHDMRFKDVGGVFTEWQLFVGSIFWELPDREGVHTIQGEFRDEFGNLTTFNDSIVLDQVAPECEVSTTGVFHNFEWLGTIQGTAGDATSGLATVSVSIQRGKDGFYFDGINWQASETSVLVSPAGSWSVAVPTAKLFDDRYTVTCNVSDRAGNTSNCTGTFSIDDTAPSCTVNTGLFSLLTWQGVTGTATDLESGIDTITVIVRRDSDGLFFNGLGWGSSVILHSVDVAEDWVLPLDVSLLHDNVSYSVDCVVRDLADNLGPTESGSFTFDGTAPSGEFRVHDAEFLNTFNVILLNFVSGATQMRFQNDGEEFGTWLPYASSLEWTLREEDGDRTVFAEYRDEAGNPLNLQDSINIDSTPPGGGFSIGENDPAETRIVDVTLYINVTDAHEMRFRDPGGEFTNWETITPTKPWTIADVEGIHTVEAEFRDVIGNVLQTSDSIELDRLPPQGSFTIGDGDPQYSLGVGVTLVFTIDDGFEMRIANDEEPFGAWMPFADSADWDLADIDGERTVRVEVRDSGGGTSSFSDNIVLDSTPPECSTGVSGTYNGESWPGLISGTLSDATSGVNSGSVSLQRVSDGHYWTGSLWSLSRTLISINPGNWLLIIGPPALGSDAYRFSCFAGDVAGNTRNASPSTFIYDAQKPNCAIDTTGDLGIASWPDHITGTASDALSAIASVDISVQRRRDSTYFNGTGWVAQLTELTPTGLETWSLELSAAFLTGGDTYDITCTATDAQGNSRQRFSTFTMDNTPPDGTFVVGDGNPLSVATRNVILFSDMTDAIHMRFSNDGIVFTEWLNYAENYAWVLPDTQGPVDVYAEFRDHVGNVLQTIDSITYDNQPPTGSFTIGAGNPELTTNRDVFLQINVVGASQMRFRNDDGSFTGFGPVISVFPWTLSSGDNELRTVHGEFRDLAGNILSASDSITIDDAGPTGSFTVGSGNPEFTKSILTTLINSVTDAVDMRFKNNNDAFGQFEAYIPVRIWTLPNIGGTHTITGEFRDERGNVLSITDQITLDLDAPAANITTIGSYGSATWPNEVSGNASDPSSGVDHVEVAVQRQSDGRYFNGVSWITGQQLLPATGADSWSLPMDVSFLSDATGYIVIAIAHDKVGNSSAPVSRSFSFDSSAPPCTIDTTGVYGPTSWPGAVSGTAETGGTNGLHSVTVSVQRSNDGQFWTGSSWGQELVRLPTIGNASWSLSLPGGQLQNNVTYLISCHPRDNVGNVGNDQRQFVFDAQPPTFSFDPPVVNVGSGATPDLLAGVTATDNIDDDVSASITTEGSVDTGTIGDYSITYRVTDSAGNSGSAQRLYRVGLIVSGQVSYAGRQSGNTIVVLQDAGEGAGATQQVTIPGGTGPFEFAVASGNYSLQAFMDIIPNQAIDPSEPIDQSLPPFIVSGLPVSNLDLRLSDWSHTFALHRGWNLISAPGPLIDPALALALPQVLGAGVIFDGEAQTYLEATEIAPRQGIWVFVPEPGAGTLRGTYDLVANVPLFEGWNLIGVRSPVDHPAFTNPGVRIVWGSGRRGLRIITAGNQLLPFRGYWINTSTASSLATGQ